jgi:hypothetical protein
MSAELTAPMVHKNEAKRIVFGPVLIPNEPDSDGDVVTVEQIERVAHKFVEAYRNIDLQHTLQNVGDLLESYITPVDLQYGELTIPKGSWMMGVRVTDDATWDKVQKGTLTGFSIMGIPAAMKSASTKSQRTTLADLGDAWVVNAVSLVDSPAVPKAKWVVIKSKHATVKAIAGSFEYRRELIEQAFTTLFPEAHDRAHVHQLFEDHVILVHWDENGDQYVDVPYTFDAESNEVTFGEPTPVTIEEYVVPIQEEPDQEEKPAEKSENPSFWTRVMKSLGFGSTKSKEVDLDMSPEDLKKLIVESVQEVLAAQAPVEKEIKPEDEVETPEAELEVPAEEEVPAEQEVPAEDAPEEDEEPAQEQEDPEPEDDKDEEDEALKATVKSLEAQVDMLMKSRRSNRLFGQDGTVAEKAAAPIKRDRDAFGRKIN